MSPSTILQVLGGSNSVQVAHIRTSFGLVWYLTARFDIFFGAKPAAAPIRIVRRLKALFCLSCMVRCVLYFDRTYNPLV